MHSLFLIRWGFILANVTPCLVGSKTDGNFRSPESGTEDHNNKDANDRQPGSLHIPNGYPATYSEMVLPAIFEGPSGGAYNSQPNVVGRNSLAEKAKSLRDRPIATEAVIADSYHSVPHESSKASCLYDEDDYDIPNEDLKASKYIESVIIGMEPTRDGRVDEQTPLVDRNDEGNSEWTTKDKVRIYYRLSLSGYHEIQSRCDCLAMEFAGGHYLPEFVLPLSICVPRQNSEPIVLCPPQEQEYSIEQTNFLHSALSRTNVKIAIHSRDVGLIKQELYYAWTVSPTVEDVFGDNTEMRFSIEFKYFQKWCDTDQFKMLNDNQTCTASIMIGVHVEANPKQSVVAYTTPGNKCANMRLETFVREFPQIIVPVDKLDRRALFQSEVARYIVKQLQALWPSASFFRTSIKDLAS